MVKGIGLIKISCHFRGNLKVVVDKSFFQEQDAIKKVDEPSYIVNFCLKA